MLAWGSPCGREMTVSSSAISPNCCASSSLRTANFCLEVRTSNKGSKACEPLTACTRVPTGPIARRVLQSFAQVPAVRYLGTGGMKGLESRLRLSGLRTNAQREARTMDSPVIRVQVGIEDLRSGARLEDEPADGAVVGQPAANGAEIGGRELPFHFSSILSTGPLLFCRVA